MCSVGEAPGMSLGTTALCHNILQLNDLQVFCDV